MHTPPNRCWAEIDLAAFERNIRRIQQHLPAKVDYISVVKADAYGHGMPQIVRRLLQSGVKRFAVANIKEAADIRHMGAGWPILVMSPTLADEANHLIDYQLTATISTQEEIHIFNQLAKARNAVIDVHLKIDTGMGRLGVWHTEATATYQAIQDASNLQLTGIYTHFSCADSNPEFTHIQRTRFQGCLSQIDTTGLLIHADNSASLASLAHTSPFNAVRIGLLQYGVSTHTNNANNKIQVESIFRFLARIGIVKRLPTGTGISYGSRHALDKDKKVAVITAGYGDGIPISLSNIGTVLAHGKRCAILGQVTMDQTIIDIDSITDIQAGDTVTLIGSNHDQNISVSEFSQKAQTIPWDTLCSITKRVERVYHGLRET